MKCELAINNSRTRQYLPGMTGGLMSILIICIIFPVCVQAQMFSVGEDRTRLGVPQTAFYIGAEPVSVDYYGNATSAQAGGFEFDGTLIRLRYESPGLNLFMGTGGAITGIENQSYFDVGGEIGYGLPLHIGERVLVQIPLELKSIYTTMTNSQFVGSATSFRFGSLMGGLGVRFMARMSENIRFEISSVPSYGLAFASGGFFGGSLGVLSGNSRVYFDRLFGDVGLALGYDFNYRNYDVDEPLYDYRIKSHSIQVGITF